MAFDFTDKVAMVTGATSGIGAATAKAFAAAGAKVVLSGRRQERGDAVVEAIKKKGGEALFVKSDVAVESEVTDLVDQALATYGRLDCAFNNAGIEGVPGPAADETEENYRKVFDVNVLGVLLAMKYQIPAILKNGGAIVNNSSVAGMLGMPGMSVYCASKHAVIGLTRAAAQEYGVQGVRINAVCPAAVETEMYQRFTGNDDAVKAQFAALHPIGRVGVPHEIADAVLWLCSVHSSFVIGQAIPIDGGFTAK